MITTDLIASDDAGTKLAQILKNMGVGEFDDHGWHAPADNVSKILFNSSIHTFISSNPPLIKVHKRGEKSVVDIYGVIYSIILDNLIGEGIYNLDRLYAFSRSRSFVEDNWPKVPVHISRLEMANLSV